MSVKKILIADDDPVQVKLLEFNLKKFGYEIITCREGLCVQPRALEEGPDLAILDLMLPGKSGLELIRDFKNDSQLSELPIIVITGQGKDSTKDELLASGADCVFTKPFSPKVLIAKINELANRTTSTPPQ